MTTPSELEPGNTDKPDTPVRPARRRWLGYSMAGLAGVLGISTITALATGGPGKWCRDGGSHGSMSWGGGRHGGGDFDPADAQRFAERRIDHLLEELNASSEQHEQVKTILGKAFEDAGGLHGERVAHRQAFADILSQPQIDRDKLQSMRDERMARMTQVSERMVQAFADAAEVLTPDQRARLGEMIGSGGLGSGRHRW